MEADTYDLIRECQRSAKRALAHHDRLVEELVRTTASLDDSRRALTDSWKVRRDTNKMLSDDRRTDAGGSPNYEKDSRRYRDRANDIRAQAEAFDEEYREMMLKIAADYEDM